MTVTMLHQKVKDGLVEQAEAAVRELFAALHRDRPGGLRYASTRVVDSSMFVVLFELADGVEDPRPSMPEFVRFVERLKDFVDGPPLIEQLDIVGSYNLFDELVTVNLPGDASGRRSLGHGDRPHDRGGHGRSGYGADPR